jgi:hypothetical protein
MALLVAAVWANRAGIWVALVAFAAFTAPHVVYHATHPADALTGFENVVNALALASGLVLAAVFAWALHVTRAQELDTPSGESARDEPLTAAR